MRMLSSADQIFRMQPVFDSKSAPAKSVKIPRRMIGLLPQTSAHVLAEPQFPRERNPESSGPIGCIGHANWKLELNRSKMPEKPNLPTEMRRMGNPGHAKD